MPELLPVEQRFMADIRATLGVPEDALVFERTRDIAHRGFRYRAVYLARPDAPEILVTDQMLRAQPRCLKFWLYEIAYKAVHGRGRSGGERDARVVGD